MCLTDFNWQNPMIHQHLPVDNPRYWQKSLKPESRPIGYEPSWQNNTFIFLYLIFPCKQGYDFSFLRRSRLFEECSAATQHKWTTQFIGGNRLAICDSKFCTFVQFEIYKWSNLWGSQVTLFKGNSEYSSTACLSVLKKVFSYISLKSPTLRYQEPPLPTSLRAMTVTK